MPLFSTLRRPLGVALTPVRLENAGRSPRLVHATSANVQTVLRRSRIVTSSGQCIQVGPCASILAALIFVLSWPIALADPDKVARGEGLELALRACIRKSGDCYLENSDGQLSTAIGELKITTRLGIFQNFEMARVPTEIGMLDEHLRSLAIQNNPELALLPTEIGMLVGLTELLLADSNELSVLPTEIGMLDKHLRSLVVQGMFALKAIPSEIGRLRHLAHLELEGNDAVSSLPSELGSLLSVKSLTISHDAATPMVVSEDISRLNALAELDVIGVCSSGGSFVLATEDKRGSNSINAC